MFSDDTIIETNNVNAIYENWLNMKKQPKNTKFTY